MFTEHEYHHIWMHPMSKSKTGLVLQWSPSMHPDGSLGNSFLLHKYDKQDDR